MRVLGVLVNEGVQFLRDDHTLGTEKSAQSPNVVAPSSSPLSQPSAPTSSSPQTSLEGLHWPRIEVALCVHRGLLFSLGGIRGIHIVGGQGPSDGTQTGHGDAIQLCIIFLEVPGGRGVTAGLANPEASKLTINLPPNPQTGIIFSFPKDLNIRSI